LTVSDSHTGEQKERETIVDNGKQQRPKRNRTSTGTDAYDRAITNTKCKRTSKQDGDHDGLQAEGKRITKKNQSLQYKSKQDAATGQGTLGAAEKRSGESGSNLNTRAQGAKRPRKNSAKRQRQWRQIPSVDHGQRPTKRPPPLDRNEEGRPTGRTGVGTGAWFTQVRPKGPVERRAGKAILNPGFTAKEQERMHHENEPAEPARDEVAVPRQLTREKEINDPKTADKGQEIRGGRSYPGSNQGCALVKPSPRIGGPDQSITSGLPAAVRGHEE
jgi:hypothetical protein